MASLQALGFWQLPVRSWYLALALSALVTAIVAPLVTWQLVNMVFRIHQLQRDLRQLATFDALPGLLNLGHGAGAHVLKSFGRMLSDLVRGSDVVGRIGGEEFLICLYGVSPEALADYYDKLIHAARLQPYFYAGQRFHVTASVGATHFKGTHLALGQLIQQADETLYQAKRAGRDQWRMYTAVKPSKHALSWEI
ncbi:GGDEF domain-containing protein [Aliidiomarina maris]|uniref:diguanylate cyclase n=1 Tax=Aliidiomarina maris TaxID=531312 RepID=A0ABY0BTK0_9GAMM|nr:GGDEF domain-containing protein [Aliidiomarina maris]MCL5049176.1 GGDEF domain-containing protein [Bacillota bacterium]RUO27406.1 hypothetical protein CWE07_05545 [Aliidiomarina maris]